MTVHELIEELQALEQDGKSNMEVRYWNNMEDPFGIEELDIIEDSEDPDAQIVRIF